MAKTPTEAAKTVDCIDKLEEYHLEWPRVFFVCKKHKEECFLDYENAILNTEKPCEICHAKDNDSLGG